MIEDGRTLWGPVGIREVMSNVKCCSPVFRSPSRALSIASKEALYTR